MGKNLVKHESIVNGKPVKILHFPKHYALANVQDCVMIMYKIYQEV